MSRLRDREEIAALKVALQEERYRVTQLRAERDRALDLLKGLAQAPNTRSFMDTCRAADEMLRAFGRLPLPGELKP